VAAARLGAALAPDAPGKLARSLRARRDLLPRLQALAAQRDRSRPLAWLHAPSVGEGLQARPVLEALRRSHPGWQLAYTWFSPSADAFASRLDVDLRGVLPFDGRREAAGLLDAWAPDALVFVKLDVWPVLAEQAAARGVRTALVSATLAPDSGRQGRLARALLGDAYAGLDAVGAISADDAARLRALGVRADRIAVTGDTRMDQVWQRAQGVGATHPVRALTRDGDLVLVAGSTWPADDAVLLPAARRWLQSHPNARLIIAPHEPTPGHLEPVERWARASGLPLRRLGDAERDPGERDPAEPWRVLLVDRVGVLGDLYALASMAFVGGGFHAAGLHSVLEPAAFGVPVLFGPRHRNAREAGELVASGGAVAVTDVEALAAQLARWSADDAARRGAGGKAQALVQAGRGSTERVVALIEGLVGERRGG
jgi:3-deoxy-D-manno-octulosonic-acid transferase